MSSAPLPPNTTTNSSTSHKPSQSPSLPDDNLDSTLFSHILSLSTTSSITSYLRSQVTPSNAPLITSYIYLLLNSPEVFDKLDRVDIIEIARFLLTDNDLVWKSFKEGSEQSQEDYQSTLYVLADHITMNISLQSILQPPFDLISMLEQIIFEMDRLPNLTGLFKLSIVEELLKSLPSVRHPVSSIPSQQLDSAFVTIRMSITTWVSRLHRFFTTLLKSVLHKALILEFFDKTLYANLGRAKLQVSGTNLMSDSEAMLLWRVLMLFCEPIILQDDKAKLIVDDFWERKDNDRALAKFVQSTDCTLLSEPKTSTQSQTLLNFISEIFYDTIFATRLGPIRLVSVLFDIEREAASIQEQLDANLLDPMRKVLAEQHLSKLTDRRLHISLYLTDLQGLVIPINGLMNRLQNWLLHIINPKDPYSYNDQFTQLQIRIPEMVTMDVINEWYSYLCKSGNLLQRLWSDSLSNPSLLLTFSCLSLRYATSFIHNPYTRAKLVEAMLAFTDPNFEHYLDTRSQAMQHAIPALIQLYVDVESTGAASQFYEKFNIRHYISLVIRCMWERHPLHRNKLIEVSNEGGEIFIRFVNLMINDVTYLLDESLTKLTEIHKAERGSRQDAENTNPQEGEENVNDLSRIERICKSCMQLTNASLSLLSSLTTQITAPFVIPELGGRLPAMLLLNMLTLTGPRCRELKVKDADKKYFFRPRDLLYSMASIIVNMRRERKFAESLVTDDRSFSDDLLTRVGNILNASTNPLHQTVANQLIELNTHLINLKNRMNKQASLVDTATIPSHFLDPLTYNLMERPTRLLTSNIVLDLSTIKAHLLNDKHDPFNRKVIRDPEDLIRDMELQKEIEEWKKEHGME